MKLNQIFPTVELREDGLEIKIRTRLVKKPTKKLNYFKLLLSFQNSITITGESSTF
jgi:hypothetical protein